MLPKRSFRLFLCKVHVFIPNRVDNVDNFVYNSDFAQFPAFSIVDNFRLSTSAENTIFFHTSASFVQFHDFEFFEQFYTIFSVHSTSEKVYAIFGGHTLCKVTEENGE